MRISAKYCLILLVCVCPLLIKAQQRKIDSLINVIRHDKEDTAKVNHLHDLISYYTWQNNDTALALCNEAMKLSESLHWQEGIGQSHYKLAIVQEGKGNYLQALKEYDQALMDWQELEGKALDDKEREQVKTR